MLSFIKYQNEMSPDQLNFLNETLTRTFIEKFLENGNVAIDAGANHGLHTSTMVSSVGTSGHVHAYEPNVLLHGSLREILRPGIDILHRLAVGARKEESDFHIPADDGWATLNPSVLGGQPRRIERVNIELMDSTICPFDKIRLIKLDIEGHELPALFGAARIVKESRPFLIIEEPYSNETVNFINTFGYESFDLLGNRLQSEEHIFPNYFGIPKEHSKLFKRRYKIDSNDVFKKYFENFNHF